MCRAAWSISYILSLISEGVVSDIMPKRTPQYFRDFWASNHQKTRRHRILPNQFVHKFSFMLKIAHSPIYKLELPEGHRFPMLKYELICEQLLYEGTVTNDHIFHPTILTADTILTTHTADYWHRLSHAELTPKEMRKVGFPLTEQLIKRTATIAGGTVECALFALKYGVSMNTAGGTHHAFTDHGEGFCLLNDVAIAANYLINNYLAKCILVIDLDVHQGNGTAEIFRKSNRKWLQNANFTQNTEGSFSELKIKNSELKNGLQAVDFAEKQPFVFTFSVHGANNYPLHKEQSDLDIGLPDGVEDKYYLTIVRENLDRLFDELQPDFVFFNSGVDVLATDKLGKLKLTQEGCRQRDLMVFEFCKRHKIPISVSMGGGYSPRVATIVEAHANTFRSAQSVFF
jgi:acetoin utilization deacetylase AcuC-like enzyme